MPDKSELLITHYQTTYDLTYKLWVQRSRTFLLLIALIGLATLLMYRPTDTNPRLVSWMAKTLGITDAQTGDVG